MIRIICRSNKIDIVILDKVCRNLKIILKVIENKVFYLVAVLSLNDNRDIKRDNQFCLIKYFNI